MCIYNTYILYRYYSENCLLYIRCAVSHYYYNIIYICDTANVYNVLISNE